MFFIRTSDTDKCSAYSHRSDLVDEFKIKLQLLTRKKRREECLRCCCCRRRRRFRCLHTSMRSRNMYLSSASLGVVNDLTCLIIIYYVFFLGRKKGSSAPKECFKDPTRDPILSICQMPARHPRAKQNKIYEIIVKQKKERFHLFPLSLVYPSTYNIFPRQRKHIAENTSFRIPQYDAYYRLGRRTSISEPSPEPTKLISFLEISLFRSDSGTTQARRSSRYFN